MVSKFRKKFLACHSTKSVKMGIEDARIRELQRQADKNISAICVGYKGKSWRCR